MAIWFKISWQNIGVHLNFRNQIHHSLLKRNHFNSIYLEILESKWQFFHLFVPQEDEACIEFVLAHARPEHHYNCTVIESSNSTYAILLPKYSNAATQLIHYSRTKFVDIFVKTTSLILATAKCFQHIKNTKTNNLNVWDGVFSGRELHSGATLC